MTFITIYLVGYFLLLAGAALALWQSGILQEIPGVWLAAALAIAIGMGIVLALASRSRAIRTTSG